MTAIKIEVWLYNKGHQPVTDTFADTLRCDLPFEELSPAALKAVRAAAATFGVEIPEPPEEYPVALKPRLPGEAGAHLSKITRTVPRTGCGPDTEYE